MPPPSREAIRVGIVADDLTGAADTAVQFVRAGWQTELQLRPGISAAQVVAVTTDSRNLSAAEAAHAAALAVKQLRNAGVSHVYKKIDSTLRGQVRAEVHAALDSWSPNAIAVVCPAFPTMGRTLIDGKLCVNGVPVSETSLGADPATPVTESHLPTLLGASHVAQNVGEAAQALADRISASGSMVVVDAAGEDDGWARWSAKVLDAFETIDVTLLLTAPLDRRKCLPPALIPERFADLTARIIEKSRARVTGVVVTGGDGARALAKALDATGFQIRGEVTSGVPVGTLVGGLADGLHFVTKAGGFGDVDTLLQAVQAVRDWSYA